MNNNFYKCITIRSKWLINYKTMGPFPLQNTRGVTFGVEQYLCSHVYLSNFLDRFLRSCQPLVAYRRRSHDFHVLKALRFCLANKKLVFARAGLLYLGYLLMAMFLLDGLWRFSFVGFIAMRSTWESGRLWLAVVLTLIGVCWGGTRTRWCLVLEHESNLSGWVQFAPMDGDSCNVRCCHGPV